METARRRERMRGAKQRHPRPQHIISKLPLERSQSFVELGGDSNRRRLSEPSEQTTSTREEQQTVVICVPIDPRRLPISLLPCRMALLDHTRVDSRRAFHESGQAEQRRQRH